MAKTTLHTGQSDVNGFIDDAPLQEKKPVQKERMNKVISITLRQSDLDEMDRFCAEKGMNRSIFLRLAASEYISKFRK